MAAATVVRMPVYVVIVVSLVMGLGRFAACAQFVKD
jgi:hypothetical protein